MMIAETRSWLFGLPREARWLVVATGTGGLTLAFAFCFYSFAATYQGWKEIGRSAPRIARLEGYELARDDIDIAANAVEMALQELAFSDDSDETQVGARLQQILRGFAEESGLTVGGSQLLPSQDGEMAPEGFTVLRVQLNMTGLPDALSAFLREVYQHAPVLDVTKLNAARARRGNNRRSKNASPDELQTLRLDVHVSALMVTQ
ncbi:MAG: hypothetical protein CME45_07190 [Halieaceae bacterium]|nr:hypothetical protein [Halieaceae bacterium]